MMKGGVEIWIGVTLVLGVVWGMPLESRATCSLCLPGSHVKNKCTDDFDTLCVQCEYGSFTNDYNDATECKLCSRCPTDSYIDKPCSLMADTVCLPCSQPPTWESPHFATACSENRVDDAQEGSDTKSKGDKSDDLLLGDDPFAAGITEGGYQDSKNDDDVNIDEDKNDATEDAKNENFKDNEGAGGDEEAVTDVETPAEGGENDDVDKDENAKVDDADDGKDENGKENEGGGDYSQVGNEKESKNEKAAENDNVVDETNSQVEDPQKEGDKDDGNVDDTTGDEATPATVDPNADNIAETKASEPMNLSPGIPNDESLTDVDSVVGGDVTSAPDDVVTKPETGDENVEEKDGDAEKEEDDEPGVGRVQVKEEDAELVTEPAPKDESTSAPVDSMEASTVAPEKDVVVDMPDDEDDDDDKDDNEPDVGRVLAEETTVEPNREPESERFTTSQQEESMETSTEMPEKVAELETADAGAKDDTDMNGVGLAEGEVTELPMTTSAPDVVTEELANDTVPSEMLESSPDNAAPSESQDAPEATTSSPVEATEPQDQTTATPDEESTSLVFLQARSDEGKDDGDDKVDDEEGNIGAVKLGPEPESETTNTTAAPPTPEAPSALTTLSATTDDDDKDNDDGQVGLVQKHDDDDVEVVSVAPKLSTTKRIPTLEELEATYFLANPEVEEGSGDLNVKMDEEDQYTRNDSHVDDAAHAGKSKHGDTDDDKENKKRTAIIVGVAVGGVAFFTLAFFVSRQCRKKKKFKTMKKVEDGTDVEEVEFHPLTHTAPDTYEDLDGKGRETNGLYRHGPKIGPPSPRTFRKSEGKFEFPENDIYSVPDKKEKNKLMSPPPAQNLSESPSDYEPLMNGVEKLKYIDDSTDDEYVNSARNSLLPSKSHDQSLSNVAEETPPASPSTPPSNHSKAAGNGTLSHQTNGPDHKSQTPTASNGTPGIVRC